MTHIGDVVAAAYYGVCGLLTLLGLYRVALLAAFLRGRRRASPPPPAPREWPHVTVQLPLYNERYVAGRLLAAVARLDYPRERLQVQILDDSTDLTAVLVRRIARILSRHGLDVEHVQRARRQGYKAGALAAGLRTAKGRLVAIFDADFVPQPDFLRRMVPHVLQPGVGLAQARWGHLNRDATWFTRLQAILLDGHFGIEQPARSFSGWFLSFNGTAGIWHREAIEAAGGWTSDTLTEDLDLSVRAQLAGWRFVYVDDVVVPGELPLDSDSFRSQQRRWTKGGVQVARKLLPRILRARLAAGVKLEATLHLTCYAAYPLLVSLAVLRTPARLLAPQANWLGLLPGEVTLLALGTLPLVLFYTLAQHRNRAAGGLRRWLRHSIPAMALGAGLAVSNALAVLEGLFGRDVRFERTPKRGGARRISTAYRAGTARIAWLELLLLVYLVACKAFGGGATLLGEVPFLALFAFGLLAMSVPSLRAAVRIGPQDAWRSPARSPS